MSQVILIEDNKNLNDLLSINLTTYVGAELIPRENAAETIQLLEILPNIDLIISNCSIKGEKTAEMLIDYIRERSPDTGLILLGDAPDTAQEMAVVIINDPKDWERVIQAAAKILNVTPATLAKKVLPDYIPLPVKYFLPLDTSCCDVYIRIKKGPDEYQFVKRIHQGDSYPKSMVRKYIDQGLSDFYIPKDIQKDFATFLSNCLVAKLEDESLDQDQHIEIIAQSYDVATSEILKMGFTTATIQLTESIVDSMIKTFEKSPDMAPLLRKIINSKTGYMYQHAHMCSIVASECLKNLGLDDDKAGHEKLAYAAFFHDISLVDDERLAKVSTYDELEAARLEADEWDLVMNHALEGAVLIRKHPEAPIGVDEIIKHHHGSPQGKGFSASHAETLPLLSQVFIVSVEFVSELLSFKEKGGQPAPIIEELYKKYPGPKMITAIKSLEKTLKKRFKKNAATKPSH